MKNIDTLSESKKAYQHKKWLEEVFDQAAPHYGEKGSTFFGEFGRRLVEHSKVAPGHFALDVATGRGAVLFPLLEVLGSKGNAVGIDISLQMLENTQVALKKAKLLDKAHLFRMDAEELSFPSDIFDAVLCGFSLFFFPHPHTALKEFLRVLKPGGSLALTTWGQSDSDWDWFRGRMKELGAEKSLKVHSFGKEEDLSSAFIQAGFIHSTVMCESHDFVYTDFEEWWAAQWSKGVRGSLEQLSSENLEKLKQEAKKRLESRNSLKEKLTVLYGIGYKAI